MSDSESNNDCDDLEVLINEQTNDEQVSSENGINNAKIGRTDDKNGNDMNNKKKKWIKTDEEKRLDKLLFGDREGFIAKIQLQTSKNKNKDDIDENNETNKKRKAAWHDSDDENAKVGEIFQKKIRVGSLADLNKEKKYKDYLTTKFQKAVTEPKWANLDREIESDSDDEILRTVGHLVKSKNQSLSQQTLSYKRLKDLNRASYAEGSISNIQFHPTSTVALAAGSSGIASIYSIDGRKNERLHSVHFKNYPIRQAKLLPNGLEAFFGGSKNYFYTYDLMKAEETRVFLPKTMTKITKFDISPCGKYFAVAGRFGDVHLMDVNSKELLHTFKQENPCCDLKFSKDSKKLLTHSTSAEMTIFDLRMERIEHTFIDDGCIMGKCLDISPNSQMLATGSNEGVCNIYIYDDIFKSAHPTPKKTIYNLRTSISSTKFNNSSEMLGICSEQVADAVKLIHFPSGTVFSNFPGFQAKVGAVRTMEFSPNSGFLALGDVRPEIPLFRLKHFNNY